MKLNNRDGVYSLLCSLTSWTSRRDGCPSWMTMERWVMPRYPISVSQLRLIKPDSVLSQWEALNRHEHCPRCNTVALSSIIAVKTVVFEAEAESCPVFAVEETLVCSVWRWTQVLQRLQCRGGKASCHFDTLEQTTHEPTFNQLSETCKTRCIGVQKDDLDGEIDLKSCVKVSEFDVEKNYGFQIQVRCRSVRNAIWTGENLLSFYSKQTSSQFPPPFCESIVMTQMYRNPLQMFTLFWSFSNPSAVFPPLFCCADAGGYVHSVCYDSWDQAELDRGFEEVHPAEQLSWPHTVIYKLIATLSNSLHLSIWWYVCVYCSHHLKAPFRQRQLLLPELLASQKSGLVLRKFQNIYNGQQVLLNNIRCLSVCPSVSFAYTHTLSAYWVSIFVQTHLIAFLPILPIKARDFKDSFIHLWHGSWNFLVVIVISASLLTENLIQSNGLIELFPYSYISWKGHQVVLLHLKV